MSKRRVDHVDPFIGVDGENNCLCGPYLPNSIVRLGPDTLPPQLSHGYDSSRPIIRFSHTHVSGTGAAGVMAMSASPLYRNAEVSVGPL